MIAVLPEQTFWGNKVSQIMDINVAVDKKMTLKPDTRDVVDLTAPERDADWSILDVRPSYWPGYN